MSELLFPLQFKRQYANSLDVDSVFTTEADMTTYLSSTRRYAGQVVTCNEFEGRVFILNNAKDTWLDVTANVDLSAYYTTAQTYSKVEVDNLIFNLSGGTGVTYLKNLLDVSTGVTLATYGQALVFDSSLNLWVNSSVTIDLSPYYTSAQTNAIFYTSAQTTALFSSTGHSHYLSGLTDVYSGATDGQFLQYNSGLSAWVPITSVGLTGNFVSKSGDTMSGELSFSFMTGTSDRVLYVNSGGTVEEGEEIVSLYFTDPTIINYLSGETNWSGRTFTNTGLTATTIYEGQRYVDENYFYEYFGGNLYRSYYAEKDHNHNDLYFTQLQLSPTAGTAVLDYRYITYAALSGLTLASLADVSLNISTLNNWSFLKYDTISGWTNYYLDLTAITWKPEAVLTGRTVAGVSGLTGGGTLNNDVYISHATKSVAQNSTTPSLSSIVVGLTFDAYGHVNSFTTADFSGTIPHFLPDLADVIITNVTQNTFQYLWHNGAQWTNTTLNVSRVSGLTDQLANCVKYNPTTTPQIINGDLIFNNNLAVQGDLSINGNIATLNVEGLYIKDNIITLNYGETGAGVSGGTGKAGLLIDRGSRPPYYIIYQDDPSTSGGTVKIGINSNLKNVMTMVENPIESAVTFWTLNDSTGFVDMSSDFIFSKTDSTLYVTNIVTTGLTINNTITNISIDSGLTEGNDSISSTKAIKDYIDSQITGENYWNIYNSNTLTPETAYTNLFIPSGITAQTLTLESGSTIYNISVNSSLTESNESISTTKAIKDYVDYLSWKNWYYIPTATTIRIAENTQNIVYGDYFVVGDLQLDGNLLILNGALHQTGSTSGTGTITFIDFYTKYEINQLLTGFTGNYYTLSGGTIYGDINATGYNITATTFYGNLVSTNVNTTNISATTITYNNQNIDDVFVNVVGDIMTGTLTISGATSNLIIDGGSIEIKTPNDGIILTSTLGVQYRITVDENGYLVSTPLV